MSLRRASWGLVLAGVGAGGGCTLDVHGTGPDGAVAAGGGGAGMGGGGVTIGPGVGGAGPTSGSGGAGVGGAGVGGAGGVGGAAPVGYSLHFSSNAQSHVEVANLDIPQNFTLEAWIKRDAGSIGGERCLVAKDRSTQGASQFRLIIEGTGQVAFMMTNASSQSGGLYSNGYRLRSASALAAGAWTHAAVTKNGTDLRLYVNGAEAAAYTTSVDLVHGDAALPFRIGARVAPNGSSPDSVFNGQIDEVRLWSEARTAQQVQDGMSQTPGMAAVGLLASWRFDEGVGDAAGDQKGAHDGVLVNGPAWVEDDAAP